MGCANLPTALLPTMAIFLCLGGAGILLLGLTSVDVGFGGVSEVAARLVGRSLMPQGVCSLADPAEARDDAGR
jgi:hypothetical protein